MEFKSCYICNKKSESLKSRLLNCTECFSCRVCKNEDYCKHLLCAECFATFDPQICNLCDYNFQYDDDTLEEEEDMMELEEDDDTMELEEEDDQVYFVGGWVQ